MTAAAPTPTALSVGASSSRTSQERLELQQFARRLHILMVERGLSQSDLAREIWGGAEDRRGYKVAKNRDRISAYLRGTALPEAENLALIAKALGVEVTDLAPDMTAAAIDRANPEVSMTTIAGHADKTHLRVNKLVPMTVAAQIIALLSKAEG